MNEPLGIHMEKSQKLREQQVESVLAAAGTPGKEQPRAARGRCPRLSEAGTEPAPGAWGGPGALLQTLSIGFISRGKDPKPAWHCSCGGHIRGF